VARKLHNWVTAYVNHTRNSESPDSFHFWTAVSTVAGALRRRVWRDERLFQWTPNFYIVLVGPPGVVSKSTSIRGGFSLLERVPGIRFGPQSMTWQALFQSLGEAQEGVEINGAIHVMSCMTCAVSELGTFLRADDQELVAQLIAMWDGQLETFGRRTLSGGEMKIVNPWMNIIACTTPSWITDNCNASMIEGGLFSRIMFVYGDKKRRLVAYPSLEAPSAEYYREQEELLHDLTSIAELAGEYQLTADALAWGKEWYERLHLARPAHLQGDRFGGYVARKQGHLHKLAMVLAAAKRDALQIEAQDLQEADYYLSIVEKDMARVFNSVGQSNNSRATQEILNYIRQRKIVSYKSLWQHFSLTLGLKDFTEALKGLYQTGWIKPKNQDGIDYLCFVEQEKSDAQT
jgi:hypothetical protein